MLTDTANAALSQTSTSRKAKRNARQQAKAQRELEKDQEARPYAYQQQAVRNAYTLGAPADDRGARARAESARAIYNDLERNNASPEELAAAQQEYKQWANWAAMPQATRNSVLQRGRKQAEFAAAKNQFAGIMNERQTPGAAELLQYEADVMAGRNPNAFKSETSSTGRKVVYKDGIPVGFSGAPPSQIISDAGERSMVNRTGLLSPQERQAIRDQAIAEAVNPTRPVQPKPVARQILENFQGARPSVTPMNFGASLDSPLYSQAPSAGNQGMDFGFPATNNAYDILSQGAPVVPVAPAPAVASSQPAPVVPVAILSPSEQLQADEVAAERKRVLDFQNQWQRDNTTASNINLIDGLLELDKPGRSSELNRFTTFSPSGVERLKQIVADAEAPDINKTLPIKFLQDWRARFIADSEIRSRKKQAESQGFQFPPPL